MNFKRYESRFKAGEFLTEFIKKENEVLFNSIKEFPHKYFCFAIPNGGVPVTESLCAQMNIGYDMLIVRKIKIPHNTEAGFGSITTDGTVIINEELLNHLRLTENEVNNSVELTKNEIKERLNFYNKELNMEDQYKRLIFDKCIFIIDDGFASGFTMLAAITMIKKYSPKKIFIAVPTSPLSSINRIEPFVDQIFCPNIRDVWNFAVADAYKKWYDVPESEVSQIINNSKFYLKE